jgi:hypothetical protein
MSRGNFRMTRQQFEEHQRRHGFMIDPSTLKEVELKFITPPKPRRMTLPEREYELILKAQNPVFFGYEAIRLKWGTDIKTGEAMWYKPDFFVIENAEGYGERFKCIEVKGPWINPRDLIRFKGARAAWPSFQFEMHQRDRDGRWTRIH